MANHAVPIRWVLLFLLLALGIGALAITFMGGSVLPTGPALL